jgi:hypothetical protein
MNRGESAAQLEDLKKAGLGSHLDLDSLQKDAQGNLTEDAKKILKQRAEALKDQITDQKSALGQKIDEAGKQKTMLANEGLDINEKLKDAIDKNNATLKDTLETQLEKHLTDNLQLDATTMAGLKTDGKLDQSKVANLLKNTKEPGFLEKLREQNKQAQQAGGMYTGFDFEKSRGFKLEDITSGFARAADLRMLGDRRNQSPVQAMADFSKHGMGAMSAARSVFGNKSGSELVGKISDLVGAGAVDLGSEKGANEIEDLLRKTNATARVAGISIKTMLAIIDSTRQLAANNPALQNMNAGASTEIALKAVATASRMGAQMSAEDYRKAGGAQGIATKEIEAGQTFSSSDMGQAQKSLLYTVKTLKPEQYENVKGMISRGEITADTLTNKGKLQELAKTLGMDPATLSTEILQNPAIAREASKHKDIEEFTQTTGMKETTFSQLQADFKAKNIDLEDIYRRTGSMDQVKIAAMRGAAGQENLMAGLDAYGQQFYDRIRQRVDDPTGEKQKQFDALVKEQAEQEKAMSKRMDASHAGLTSQIFDALMKGGSVKDKAQRVSEVFAVTKKIAGSDKASKANQKAQEATVRAIDLLTGPDGRKLTDEDILKKTNAEGGLEVVDILNKQIAAGREAAMAYGDTATAESMRDIDLSHLPTNEARAAALQTSLSTIKNTAYSSAQEASEDLKNLKEKARSGQTLSDPEQARLSALTMLGSTVTNERGLAELKKGKFSVRALMAATPAAQADRVAHYELEESKKGIIQNVGQQLEQIAGRTPITDSEKSDQANLKEVLGRYRGRDGKVDYKRMYDEYQHKTGYFGGLSEDKMKALNEGQFGIKMQSVTKMIEQEQDKLAASGGAAGDPSKAMGASVDALKESVDKLNDELSAGGGIAKAISGLAAQIANAGAQTPPGPGP